MKYMDLGLEELKRASGRMCIRHMAEGDLPDILDFLKLDAVLWKDDRFSLITQLSFQRCSHSHLEPAGFLMCGNVGNITIAGPWEVEGADKKIAEKLFISWLSKLESGQKILLDVPAENKTAQKILKKHAFRIMGSTALMARGRVPKINFNEIFSFASMGSMG